LIAGAAAGGAAAEPAGGRSPIPEGAADVDPVEDAAGEEAAGGEDVEAGDAEDEFCGAFRHEGNASEAANTST